MNFKTLDQFIRAHDTITIFTHIYPDGDAIGSIIGLRELIKTNFPHKKVYAIGSKTPPFVSIVGETDQVDDELIAQSAALVVDVANKERVEDQRFLKAAHSYKIDHHVYVESYTEDELVLTNRIATAEIVGEFIIAMDYKINELGATALLLGILTDSGRFMYDLTSALTFKVVTALMEQGANLQKINNELSTRTLESVRNRGFVMDNIQISNNVLYVVANSAALKEHNIAASGGSQFVNSFGNIEGYPIWTTFFEDESGKVFVELRSKNKNIQKVAVQFGGGGHLKASGCRLTSINDIPRVLEALNEAEDI